MVLKENIRLMEMQFSYHTYGMHFTEVKQFLKGKKKSHKYTNCFTLFCYSTQFKSATGNLIYEALALEDRA